MDVSGSLNYRKIVFLTDLSPQKKADTCCCVSAYRQRFLLRPPLSMKFIFPLRFYQLCPLYKSQLPI